MRSQKPAAGILIQGEYPDSKFFKVPCDCGCETEIDFMVEVDDCCIAVHMFSETSTNTWRDRFRQNYGEDWWIVYVLKSFANDALNRISVAWRALVHGRVTTESSVILSEQQALNFSQTLRDSIDEFKQRQENSV